MGADVITAVIDDLAWGLRATLVCILRVLLRIRDAEGCVGLRRNDIFDPLGMCLGQGCR